MFEYCLIVYLTMQEPKYIGNFESCAYANEYVKDALSKRQNIKKF